MCYKHKWRFFLCVTIAIAICSSVYGMLMVCLWYAVIRVELWGEGDYRGRGDGGKEREGEEKREGRGGKRRKENGKKM